VSESAVGWWAELVGKIDHGAQAWNAAASVATAVTFTRQSPREISLAHRSASVELRFEGTRIRMIRRTGGPERDNMRAPAIVEFDDDSGEAFMAGQPTSVDRVAEHVVRLVYGRVAGA
jgi:hypothetical protein